MRILISGVLLGLGFHVSSVFMFFALTPLFSIISSKHNDVIKSLFVYLSLLLFNVLTLYWLHSASLTALIVACFINALFMWGPFIVLIRSSNYSMFLCSYIIYEFVYLYTVITWPFLNLGNSLDVNWIQWYEYTGVLGGSFWILLINILIYKRNYFYLFICFGIPVFFSYLFFENEKNIDTIKVNIVQPNLPALEKFNISSKETVDLLINMMDKQAEYIICPETAITGSNRLDDIYDNNNIKRIQAVLDDNVFISGIEIHEFYNSISESSTAKSFKGGGAYEAYDMYNGGIYISKDDIELNFKTRFIPEIEIKIVDLGLEMQGFLGVKDHKNKNILKDIIVVFCFEALFPNLVSAPVTSDTKFISILANDSWFDEPFVYEMFFKFAQIRAIENRRSVIRSANTGISGFIDYQGNVIFKTNTNERVSVTKNIPIISRITLFTRMGNWVGWGSVLFFILFLIQHICKRC